MTQNTIDQLYSKASNAVNRLSVADNHWTFQKVPGQYAWWCINHGHREALLKLEFSRDHRLSWIVYDIGLVRFNNGQSKFQFTQDDILTDDQEDVFLDQQLIGPLNILHGVVIEIESDEDAG